jgi:hypothetical protein
MPITNTITRHHLISALNRIGSLDNIPSKRRARRVALRYNNRNYPLKFVICIAHEIATGQEYSYKEFTTNMARDYINTLGEFDIIEI